MKTERYQRISGSLKDPLNLSYTSFCAFATNDFESFLLPFQSKEPMIHLLYPEMYKLLESSMTKFIRKKRLANISSDDMHKIDVTIETNHKPVNMIDVGTKAKVLFSVVDFIQSEKHVKFRRECVQFYISSVKYLQVQLPFDIAVIKHAQYLHPEKRNQSGATSAFCNLALKIANVLKNRLTVVFGVKQDATKDDVCDTIRNQWMRYQNEEIPEDFYIVSCTDESSSSSSRTQDSYWAYAHEVCGMPRVDKSPNKFVRIDKYWSKIGELVDDKGCYKYQQLIALIKCVLSVSHGNAVPERGFSINNILLGSS